MVSEKYFEAQHSNKISHFFTKANNINPCFLQTSRIVLCNNLNPQMKNPIKIFNLNPNSTKATVRNFNYTIKSENTYNKFNCMLNFNKGFFNSSNNINNTRNFNETNCFDIKSFPSDNIIIYNKSHDMKNSNSIINKFKQNYNNKVKGFDYSSTRNSNMTSINYKTQIFGNNIKDSNNVNKAQNSIINEKSIEKSSNNKILDQKNLLYNSSNYKNSKKKKNKVAKNINHIIRSIYDYSDISLDNSNSFNHKKNLDQIIEEKIPVNNKILMKHNEGNFFPQTQCDLKENEENNLKMIKLSLMEKYLISTDYSMNLTYKMRYVIFYFLFKF